MIYIIILTLHLFRLQNLPNMQKVSQKQAGNHEVIYTFAGGPTMLTKQLKFQLQQKMQQRTNGLSILQLNSNSKQYHQLTKATEENLRSLLSIPKQYNVWFLNGGCHLQFASIPLNIVRWNKNSRANYTTTGYFSKLAFTEAQKIMNAREIAKITYDENGKYTLPENYDYWQNAAYTHFVDNETVEGLQYPQDKIPFQKQVPLILDSSSSLLTKPIDWDKVSLCYGHAQKNCGISGLTTFIIDPKLIDSSVDKSVIPSICDFRQYKKLKGMSSTLNALPLFAHYQMTQYIKQNGGVNRQKYWKRAQKIYTAIQNSRIYNPLVRKQFRSRINVTWRINDQQLQKRCIQQGAKNGLYEFKGHRTTGGFRASLFIPIPDEGISKLADFLSQFELKQLS